MKLTLSDLDLKRFGVLTAKSDTFESVDDVERTISFCTESNAKLLIARVDADRLDLAQRLESHGAFLCDTLIYYELRIRRSRANRSADSEFIVRRIEPNDREPVLKIAREAFSGYFGHYHSDPRLRKADCDETYVSWCESTIDNIDATTDVLIIEDANGICGFITLRAHDDSRLELVLSGIAHQYTGRGVYRRLIEAGVEYARAKKMRRVFTSTQISNLAVQWVWISQGFNPIKSSHTFHAWF